MIKVFYQIILLICFALTAISKDVSLLDNLNYSKSAYSENNIKCVYHVNSGFSTKIEDIKLYNEINSIVIEFSKLDTSHFIYKYYLEGYEKPWKLINNNQDLVYANLKPGKYVLHYFTQKNEAKTLNITVYPPFWKNKLYYFLFGALGLLILVFYIHFREKRISRLKGMLDETVRNKTLELVQQKEDIERQKEEILKQRDKIELQKDKLERKQLTVEFALNKVEESRMLLEDKNKEITDSIMYAKRIQESIFPPESQIKRLLPDSFIYFKPKDILSGDFYWVEQYPTPFYSDILDVSKPENIIVGAVDCTGHGVPGALMSIVGNNLITNAIDEFSFVRPADILKELNRGINQTLKHTFDDSVIKDGMDIALISYEIATSKLYFAGAKNPIYLIRDNELIVYKANRHSIGYYETPDGKEITFDEHIIDIKKNDMLYLFSDGYADQFGGLEDKKFKYERFKKLLLNIHSLPVEEQYQILDTTFLDWKRHLDQVDDILIIGIRF